MPSEDEYDQLPDPFAGVDWNIVPGLCNVPLTPQSHDRTSCGGDTTTELGHSALTPPNAEDSSQYPCEEVDAAFLAEIDEVERKLLQPRVAGPGGTSTPITSADGRQDVSRVSDSGDELISRYFHDRHAESDPTELQIQGANSHAESNKGRPWPISEAEVKSTKVVHRLSSPPTRESSPKKHKGKQKESSKKRLKEFLSNLEDEMICPICCDIFAFAHLGNPCGHTFCGECGWRWIKRNREAPSCAICRASLSVDTPMIPNFSVDNAIEKHVQALRANETKGWENDGSKFTEWQARKAKWKADSSTRQTARKSTKANFSSLVALYALGDSGGSDYVEDVEEAESSGGGRSRSPESGSEQEVGVTVPQPEHEEISRRSANHYHQANHHRRTGSNRPNRVGNQRHDGRGGSGPRGRRSRRRRRREGNAT